MPSEYAVVPTEAIHDDDLTDSQLRKLATIASYADENSLCWPSLSTLAEQWGIKKSGASKAVKSLEDLGWLVRIPRKNEDGGTGSNVYYICRHRYSYPDWIEGLKERGVESHEFNGGLNPMSSMGPLRSREQTTRTSKANSANKAELPPPSPTEFKNYWNKKVPSDLQIKRMTSNRKEKLRVRRKEDYFVENWKEVIDKVSESEFLKENFSGFDVNWVLRNDHNYVKIHEGKYDDDQDNDTDDMEERWNNA